MLTKNRTKIIYCLIPIPSTTPSTPPTIPTSTNPDASAVEQASAEILTLCFNDWGSENTLGTSNLFAELITEILGWTITTRFIVQWSSLTVRLNNTQYTLPCQKHPQSL
ncbi:hypothetical protein VP01_7g32 [Puccinia sorghi]|uniref:Uncharacterized protein n=1 Tax=Puccinia sorghi TaxID=27349 RepID=A0A0L6UBE8_9BASI|nr:hypothetical protein VP01_7g32 [Puccinia sorghi]